MIRQPPRSTLFPYTDALPIVRSRSVATYVVVTALAVWLSMGPGGGPLYKWLFRIVPGPIEDRKSTRLNSSHTVISYAVFCLKKKKKIKKIRKPIYIQGRKYIE